MKISVRLFGTLARDFPGYHRAAGLEVEIPENATAGDLLFQLKFAESRSAVVAVNGKLMKPDDILPAGAIVNVFQSVFGG